MEPLEEPRLPGGPPRRSLRRCPTGRPPHSPPATAAIALRCPIQRLAHRDAPVVTESAGRLTANRGLPPPLPARRQHDVKATWETGVEAVVPPLYAHLQKSVRGGVEKSGPDSFFRSVDMRMGRSRGKKYRLPPLWQVVPAALCPHWLPRALWGPAPFTARARQTDGAPRASVACSVGEAPAPRSPWEHASVAPDGATPSRAGLAA
jgi:hypothetical protein